MNQINNKTIQIVTLVVSSHSLLGAIFIILLYLTFKKLRVFPFKYVFLLSVSDVILSLGFILVAVFIDQDQSYIQTSIICKIQAILINYGELASIFWTTCIAFTLYDSIINAQNKIQQTYDRKFFLFTFGLPLLMTIFPLFTDQFGDLGGWCWIKNDDQNLMKTLIMRGIQFYIPLWLAFIYNGYTIFKVIRYLRIVTQDKNQLKIVNRLVLYPLILLVCWSAGTVNVLFNFLGKSSDTLSAIHVGLGGIQGFFNALVYGLNSTVRKTVKENIHYIIPCCKFYNVKSYVEQKEERQKSSSSQNVDIQHLSK